MFQPFSLSVLCMSFSVSVLHYLIKHMSVSFASAHKILVSIALQNFFNHLLQLVQTLFLSFCIPTSPSVKNLLMQYAHTIKIQVHKEKEPLSFFLVNLSTRLSFSLCNPEDFKSELREQLPLIAGSAAAGVVFIVSLIAISIVCSR